MHEIPLSRGQRRAVTGLVATVTLVTTGVVLPGPSLSVEPPNGPNYTVFSGTTLSLCGTHAFGDLTLQSGAPGGTIRVATAADPADPTGTGPSCVAGSEGLLTITADRVTNHGRILADGSGVVAHGAAASGNSGGGHAGSGGQGSSGSPGGEFADLTTAPVTESGGPGGRTSGSISGGGGALTILAGDYLLSDGTIRADGVDGADSLTNTNGTGNTCAHTFLLDGVPQNIPNGGIAARSGGGAGGGIVLAAETLDLRGTTAAEFGAAGGEGGSSYIGAGGGGSGGVVKLVAPIQLFDAGFAPGAPGGAGGVKLCPEATGGGVGEVGQVVTDASPRSQALDTVDFWNLPTAIVVPFRAAAAYQTSSGFRTTLCGLRADAGAGVPDAGDFPAPPANDPSDPCGTAVELGARDVPPGTSAVAPPGASASLPVTLPSVTDTAWWGVYTVTVRSGTGPDRVESPPASVDTVFGVDARAPVIAHDAAHDSCALPGSAGWCRGAQQVAFTATDGQSGLADAGQAAFTRTTSAQGAGVMVASGPVADKLANTNPGITVGPYKIDATPPTLTCQSPTPTFLQGATAAVSATVSDGLSGPSSPTASAAADTSTPGTRSVAIAGSDVAGNQATVSCGYSVLETTRSCTSTTLLFGSSCTVQLVCPSTGDGCTARVTASAAGVPLTGTVSATAGLQRTAPVASTSTTCWALGSCSATEGPRPVAPGGVVRGVCTSGGIGIIGIRLVCTLRLT